MKFKNLFLAINLLFTINMLYGFPQIVVDTLLPTIEDSVFTKVEQMPIFTNSCKGNYAEKQKCGEKAFLEFIYKNIKYPTIARENGIEGKVVVSFIIEKDGTISNIELIRNPMVEIGEEIVRVIKKIPLQSWEAGKQDGELVRVKFYLPITICLE